MSDSSNRKDRYLTVFVAVYNIEKYLDRLFECMKNQTFDDYELLIMDDGSTDSSLEICKRYAKEDDRIRVVSLPHRGLAATRMSTYKELRTEFAVCVDGDDWIEPDYLKHLVDAQKKYNADLVTSNVFMHNEKGEVIYKFPDREEGFFRKEDYPEILPKLLLEDRLNYMYGRIYRSEFLKKINVGIEDMGEDTRTVTQYLMYTNNLAVIDEYDYHYIRYNSRAITASLGNEMFNKLYAINQFVYELMKKNDLLNNEMIKSIDIRNFSAGKKTLDQIVYYNQSRREKYAMADRIINSKEYTKSYNRQKECGNLKTLDFKPIAPGKGAKYIKKSLRKIRARVYKYRIRQLMSKILKNEEKHS
ncbi:MAG: glycosyltransferase [Eubacterium sp.]|nr:glycosyltransferase [Eubacterium sp.]